MVKSAWSPHGKKMSSATIWVDVTTIKCTVLPKWAAESQYLIQLSHYAVWHGGRRSQRKEDKTTYCFFSCQHFGWWCPTCCTKQCHQTHFHVLSWQPRFSSLMSSVPSGLFMARKKFSLKSNQTRQVKPYPAHLCGLAPIPCLQVICFT